MLMGVEISGLPRVTREIFRDFIEMMKYHVSKAKDVTATTFKGKNRFFTHEISDLGICVQAEVTDDGDCIIHWEPVKEAGMRYIADALTFDHIMATRVLPGAAFLQKKIRIVGPLGDVVGFLAVGFVV